MHKMSIEDAMVSGRKKFSNEIEVPPEFRKPAQIDDGTAAKAEAIIAKGAVRASGYHLKIFPLASDTALKAGEKEKYAELAKLGFKAASDRQAMRETKGSDFAVVVDVGPLAWKDDRLGGQQWAKPGQVVRYLRYAGLEFEEPPGSGKVFRIINDEDVLGIYEEVIK